MTAKFCPECKNIVIPEKSLSSNLIVKCAECGFSRAYKGKHLIEKENFLKKEKIGKKILNEENEFADYTHKCAKCGYKKAQMIDLGAQYSDEDNLILLKCGKCGWSERTSNKVG